MIQWKEIFADYFPRKTNSARNNCLTIDVTCAIALMEDELAIELCMRGYQVYSEATAGEELLCEREPRKRTVTDMPSASCGKIFRVFNINIRGHTSSANTKNFPTAKLTATTVSMCVRVCTCACVHVCVCACVCVCMCVCVHVCVCMCVCTCVCARTCMCMNRVFCFFTHLKLQALASTVQWAINYSCSCTINPQHQNLLYTISWYCETF